MTVVYLDRVVLLNLAVDYLLLVCAAKLGGGRILRLRLALAAAFGGVYAAAALFPVQDEPEEKEAAGHEH